MKKYLFFLVCLISINLTGSAQQLSSDVNRVPSASSVAPVKAKHKMQIVFALDATGSMSGLIAAAKDKIWSIASSITQADPSPDLELGLVFYRDRGDDFITKLVPLTDSIDLVYAELMKIQAKGGGDGPESVNQGLYEAVTKFRWDESTSVYKSIFLIGDYPPHMDYRNDVQYPESCVLARGKDIVINTIQMGNNSETERIWKLIAACHEGSFVMADMKVNDIAIATPYDVEIARINDSLEGMHFYYGSAKVKSEGMKISSMGNNIKSLSAANIQAQRAEYKYTQMAKKSAGRIATNSLIDDISNNVTSLDKLKDEELPDEMKKMTIEQRKEFVQKKLAEKTGLQKRLAEKINARNNYINSELAKKNKGTVETSFNSILFENIKTQSGKKNIHLKGKAKF